MRVAAGAAAAGAGTAGAWRWLVRVGATAACALAAHAAVNATLLRRPPPAGDAVVEPVSVLLPVRDEATRVGDCLASVLAQCGLGALEVVVVDDGSTDATAALVEQVAAVDPRVRLIPAGPLPAGWLGKPHACTVAAAAATGSVLVFVDADVVLATDALARAVALLRQTGLDLVSPYPRQLAGSPAERVVQPLLQWSWLTFLPLRLAERSPRPSLAAANGQLLVVDAAAYHAAGGHSAVRAQVLEDVALLRAVKRAGGRGGVVDGTDLATCRMYGGWADLRDGYTKSLWSAFGSRFGAAAVVGALAVAYVVPPVAALTGSRAGAVGAAAGVAGRVVAARRTGGRAWPDAVAHPASVVLVGWLTARSWRHCRRGDLRWKGRDLTAAAEVGHGGPSGPGS